MTQHERIIAYVKAHGSITPFEAFRELGITKLATRVGEIERAGGAAFAHIRQDDVNKYGERVTYMKYVLRGED